jgi:hypothetical protein
MLSSCLSIAKSSHKILFVQLIDVVKELSGRIEVMEKKQVSSLCYNLMKCLASVILSHAILNLWKCYMPKKNPEITL